MCGRYSNTKDLSELAKAVELVCRIAFFAPRYNIAPTQTAPVICLENNQPSMKVMRWGLIPAWSKDETVGGKMINARVETLREKPSFRQALEKRRCLIPADSFYEWKVSEGKKQPFRVMLKSGEQFCFAGLWEKWVRPASSGQLDSDLDEAPPSQTVESFTIITTQANETMAPLHDRMPVIVDPKHYRWWLLNDRPNSELFMMPLNHQRHDPLKIYPVSNLVNDVKTDDPRCVEPVLIERDMFEKPWWGD